MIYYFRFPYVVYAKGLYARLDRVFKFLDSFTQVDNFLNKLFVNVLIIKDTSLLRKWVLMWVSNDHIQHVIHCDIVKTMW
jgi:hypothetical protein